MQTGIGINNYEVIKDAVRADFKYIDITADFMSEITENGQGIDFQAGIISITQPYRTLDALRWEQIVNFAVVNKVPYIVLSTENVEKVGDVPSFMLQSAQLLFDNNITVCIENGYCEKNGHLVRNNTSDAVLLAYKVNSWNKQLGRQCVRAAVNTGCANIMALNIGALIEELGNYVAYIHVNDNDALHDMRQMPHTFTSGRGSLSTRWYNIIWSLTKLKYSGPFVFDIYGTIKNTPKPLVHNMLELAMALSNEWQNQIDIEKRLGVPGKKLILFGAGRMFQDYMSTWGENYKPVFCVDNNPDMWGKTLFGVEVKKPEAILEVPEPERNVWICNMYYRQIAAQLDEMGVKAQWFNDQYIL